MRSWNKLFHSILVLIFISSGCARAISKELRIQMKDEINIKQAIKNPDTYHGKMVIWGGIIVKAENLKKGTLLEIVQKPVTLEKRPRPVDQSDGRFLALYEGYLDVAIYSEGREVTVAGRLKELKEKLLGEIEYTYPVVSAEEVHLWPPRQKKEYYIYPQPYWHYPWYHHYPNRFDLWCW